MVDRWDMNVRSAFRLIGAFEVADKLRPIGHILPSKMATIVAILPTKESQVRELLKIDDDKDRAIVWQNVLDHDTKEARNKKIFDLWMRCYTQQEIADAVGCDPTDKILRVSGNTENLPKNQKASADQYLFRYSRG